MSNGIEVDTDFIGENSIFSYNVAYRELRRLYRAHELSDKAAICIYPTPPEEGEEVNPTRFDEFYVEDFPRVIWRDAPTGLWLLSLMHGKVADREWCARKYEQFHRVGTRIFYGKWLWANLIVSRHFHIWGLSEAPREVEYALKLACVALAWSLCVESLPQSKAGEKRYLKTVVLRYRYWRWGGHVQTKWTHVGDLEPSAK